MKKTLLAAFALLLLMTGTTFAQQRWQADIQILSVSVTEVPGELRAKIKVYNENDDAARRATLRVLLPVEVQFLRSSNDLCTANVLRSNLPTHGIVECQLGDMGVGASQIIEVVTTVPPMGWNINKTFGAFVWSLSPDPKPGNNYGEGSTP